MIDDKVGDKNDDLLTFQEKEEVKYNARCAKDDGDAFYWNIYCSDGPSQCWFWNKKCRIGHTIAYGNMSTENSLTTNA